MRKEWSYAEESKNFDINLKILLDHQNNYIEHLSIDDNAAKYFNILAISLNVLHNYYILMVQQNYFQDCIWLYF